MKEEENQQENAEHHGDRSTNFLGEIPEAWKRRARAAFGYTFCVVMLVVVPCEIATRIFPAVTWLATVSDVFQSIGLHLYHYGVGLGVGIVAPCLVWENIMYLREKRRREREQRAREHAEAVTAQFRERVSALENELRNREQAAALTAQLQERIRALENELRDREQAASLNAQLQNEVSTLRDQVSHLNRELAALKAQSQPHDNRQEN